MSLRIGTALRDGFVQLVSRTGVALVAAYVVLMSVYLPATNGLFQRLYEAYDLPGAEQYSPALDAAPEVLVGLVGISMLLSLYVTVVAIRAFVAGERRSVFGIFTPRGVVWPAINLVVGMLVFFVVIYFGFLFLILPGIFLAVSLVFWTVYVVDERENFLSAMRDSWGLARGNRWRILFLFVIVGAVTGAVNVLGVVAAMLDGIPNFQAALLEWASVVLIAPASLYSLAVIVSAYNQLRGDGGGDDHEDDDGDDDGDEDVEDVEDDEGDEDDEDEDEDDDHEDDDDSDDGDGDAEEDGDEDESDSDDDGDDDDDGEDDGDDDDDDDDGDDDDDDGEDDGDDDDGED